MSFIEKFIDKNIAELAEEYDKIKGANTNLARIAPDLIDGLTRVRRRTLYAMFLVKQGKTERKVATIDGEVIGKFHPHGPSSVYDALVSMGQWWDNSIQLIDDCETNYGTISGDVAGADRYIKAKLSEYAYACFFEDWKYSVVDMELAFNEEEDEPIYLPAKYPNVLLNGCQGIGYGMATNMPPFNFKEIIDATIMLMMNPDAKIILIPDSPTGADIIEDDFARICDSGNGKYKMRCKYEIDAQNNIITITNLPYGISANNIREKIADIKENGGLSNLISMNDMSGKDIKIELIIEDNVNPYKFMKKLINKVADLEKVYPVNITVTDDLELYDWSVKKLILEWIRWRREQKRIVISHKRTSLIAEDRENEVKIFLMNEDHLDETIKIFKESRNRTEIEKTLIARYKDSPIHMDSLQAKTLSTMRMYELSKESYEKCLEERERIYQELKDVEETLNTDNGIDKLIIAELRDGAKRFGSPRKSNVVSYKINTAVESEGTSVLQLSSDGMVVRKLATNVYEEPIPIDTNGFAVRVENDEAFILIDENGYHTFVSVKDIPLDVEVPVNRYGRNDISGNIVAMLPYDIESDMTCTLVSRKGMLKRFRISDMKPSKKPFIVMEEGDKLVRGIVTRIKSSKDILVYTKEGMGQRLDPNTIRLTSPLAKGTYGFKLRDDDEIIGCYRIDPEENQYLLYITTNGKMRLNLIEYLPARDSKHDSMLKLIVVSNRDKLQSIIGCNKLDKVQVFFDNGEDEIIEVSRLDEATMASEPKKVTKQNSVTTNILKAKIV